MASEGATLPISTYESLSLYLDSYLPLHQLPIKKYGEEYRHRLEATFPERQPSLPGIQEKQTRRRHSRDNFLLGSLGYRKLLRKGLDSGHIERESMSQGRAPMESHIVSARPLRRFLSSPRLRISRSSSKTPFDVSTASKNDIIRHFDWCNFRDREGHKLTMCQDFHDLLARISS